MLIKTNSFLDYDFNETSKLLESRILESGARDAGFMIVKKGFPNIMHVKINEITQTIEDSFGSLSDDLFHQYFTEENHCDDTPYRVN